MHGNLLLYLSNFLLQPGCMYSVAKADLELFRSDCPGGVVGYWTNTLIDHQTWGQNTEGLVAK